MPQYLLRSLAAKVQGIFRIVPRKGLADGAKTAPPNSEASWLADSRKLIPGEALAGYHSLQPLSKLAAHPANIVVVLALVFAVVTTVLRWIGTQDPTDNNAGGTTQWWVVLISLLSFVSLVYATGGQMWWHRPIDDQQLYGQIAAAALGLLGPTLYRRVLTKS